MKFESDQLSYHIRQFWAKNLYLLSFGLWLPEPRVTNTTDFPLWDCFYLLAFCDSVNNLFPSVTLFLPTFLLWLCDPSHCQISLCDPVNHIGLTARFPSVTLWTMGHFYLISFCDCISRFQGRSWTIPSFTYSSIRQDISLLIELLYRVNLGLIDW